MSSAASSHHSSRLSSTAAEARFHGVLTVSKNRVIRRLNFNFFSYIFLLLPPSNYFLIIIEGVRYLQWYLPCLIPGSRVLYPDGSSSQLYVGILSAFNRLVPAFIDTEYYIIFASIYIAVFVSFYILFFISLYLFSKNSMIPRQITWFIVNFFESIWVIMQPIILAVTGDQFGLIFIHNKDVGNVSVWICFIFVVIVYCIIGFCHEAYVSISLSFRPSSIPAYHHNLEITILHLTGGLSFITSLLPYCGKGVKITLYIFSILIYLSSFAFVPLLSCFIKIRHASVFFAISCSAVTTIIINMIFDLLGMPMNSIVLLVEYLIIIIFIIIFTMTSKNRIIKTTFVLDRIADNPDCFDNEILNIFQAIIYAGIGFSTSHPIVNNWKFLRMTTERWPYVSSTWMIWARFVSCFPDENRLLLWIDDQIQRFIYHAESIQHFRAQIHYIVQRREASMTSQLKRKVAECNRLTVACRSRMRAYWESVMQGNAFDMEASALAAQNSIEEAETTIQHLLSMYPNNQYVTNSYLRFLTGIKADPIEVKKWTNNYNALKSGQTITPDIPQQQGIALFPNLLSLTVAKQSAGLQTALIPDVVTSQSSRMPPSSPNSARTDENNEENGNPLLASIRVSIYDLSVPAIKNASIVLSVFFALIFAIIFPISLALTQSHFKVHNDFMTVMSQASSMRCDMAQLTFFCIEYLTQLTGLEPLKSEITGSLEDNVPIINSTDNIRNLITSIENAGNNLRQLNTLQSKGPYIKKAYQILFESINKYRYYSVLEWPNISMIHVSLSVESTAISAKLFASSLISMESLHEIVEFVHTEQIINVVHNAYQSTDYITEACHQIEKQIKENCSNLRHTVLIIGICLAVIFFVAYTIAISMLSLKFNSNKRATAKCFLMIPKHVVSSVVDSFRRTSTSTFIDTVSDINNVSESHKNKQEENFLATLSSAVTNQWTVYGSVILISTYQFLVMICAIIGALYIYFSTSQMCEFCEIHSPFHNYIMMPYTETVLAINSLYLIVVADLHHPVVGITREDMIELGLKAAEKMKFYYSTLLFGNITLGVENIGYLSSQYIIDGFTNTKHYNFTDFSNFHAVYDSMSASSQFYLMNMIINRALARSKVEKMTLYNEHLTNIWHIAYAHFYMNYMRDVGLSLPNTTVADYEVIREKITIIYAILYLLAVFFFALSIIKLVNINSNIKWMIATMLQCPPEVLVASESVMRILSGSFKEIIYKAPNFSDNLYNTVTNDSDDAFLVTSTDTTIISASKACKDIFGMEPQSLIGKAFRELLVGSNGSTSMIHDQSADDFLNKLDTAISGRSSLTFTHMVKIGEEGSDPKYINITLTAFSKNGIVKSLIKAKGKLTMLSFVCQDVTENVTTDLKLIQERKKAEKMLQTIVPPKIVSLIDKNDPNISIVAQSASTICISIHDFDITVGSISASQTMSTLTRVYSEFDAIIERTEAMMKVKTVADLYLAVGGIMAGSNQPDTHAKECVQFGIDCVRKISEITKEIGLPLKLKIGVNTGGPVIAGLLNIDRPTFNVIGTPIEIALNLMTLGDPMMLHISRYVYELIFGASFKIREGKEIELKSGTISTYFIDPL
ncbi:hypothetical protein TRFO_02833 [Tritrichomonas foetus]|uniref:Adenylate and Guanylate cyclase catalytic domain containing protein n=1 Tax=Tritrichomonas foetus TaxID=1144522 RepID=A0A1J4KW20_9EUKA|nr:hypothetical protein TRFO_02833 [Tritrichomonas foetus]|eukprot:OHT15513.1 hypothetical protein TRFO_02833 [Tritrichomonas foetus]